MESYLSLADNLIEIAKDALSGLTWVTVLVTLAVTCITTRIITDFQCRSSKTVSGDFRPVRIAPYWFPWLGHSLSFAWSMTSCVRKARLAFLWTYQAQFIWGLIELLGTTWVNPSLALFLVVRNKMW